MLDRKFPTQYVDPRLFVILNWVEQISLRSARATTRPGCHSSAGNPPPADGNLDKQGLVCNNSDYLEVCSLISVIMAKAKAAKKQAVQVVKAQKAEIASKKKVPVKVISTAVLMFHECVGMIKYILISSIFGRRKNLLQMSPTQRRRRRRQLHLSQTV
jgi:hypothetical protein